jgi:hypothetical protein
VARRRSDSCRLNAVSRKHRRTWTTIRDGALHSLSGYQASIAKLDSSRGAIVLVNLLDWITGPSGIEAFEPRYRVLIGRPDSDAPVGVAVARTLRRAIKQLDQVDRVLAARTHDEVRTEFALDF